MSPTNNPTSGNRKQSAMNLTLAAVVGQVGCLTTVIIVAALFLGLWLDSRLDTKPMFTFGAVIASMPVSLVLMVFLTRSITARIKTQDQLDSQTSEEEGGVNK